MRRHPLPIVPVPGRRPPDTAKYLPALFERKDLLTDFGIWAADAIAGDLFTTLLYLLVVLYVWRRLPARVRHRLHAMYESFLPSGTDAEGMQSEEASLQDGAKPLREEIGALNERLDAHEQCMKEIVDRQQRQIDRLQRELWEARQPWWKRLFKR